MKTNGNLCRVGSEVFETRTMVVILVLARATAIDLELNLEDFFLLSAVRRRADKVGRWLTELKEQTEQSDKGKDLP